jgi:hypothetical protein
MATKNWDELTTADQRKFLDEFDDAVLAQRYKRPQDFFVHLRAFFASIPEQTIKPEGRSHPPPKDLLVSARRDLSFYEANFELFDNAIDEWRRRGSRKELHIRVDYDLELLTGKYVDDAGGMEEKDVFRVFIPGETTNRDFSQNVIGSFGMGAKKGIFRLTDGAKIVSCPDGDVSYTSEVPERWEDDPSWETRDGRAAPLRKGTTELFFFKLFKPPSLAEIDDLRQRVGRIYAPLLTAKFADFGKKPDKKIHISINEVEAVASSDIHWSSPKGAQPRLYEFSHVFRDFLSTGKDIELVFLFYCGLIRKQAGISSEDQERDFGIDVYGNGRLIQPFLKDPFGWGTSGLSKSEPASRFIRGQVFINGHSFAIPWDTHKREYLSDHPVAQWLYEQLRPVIKSYLSIARRFASDTDLRNRVLLTSKPEEQVKATPLTLPVGEAPPEEVLPKWEYKSNATKGKGGATKKLGPTTVLTEEESHARLAEATNGERVISITLPSADYEDLMGRFETATSEELETAVRECLTGGVAFSLTAEQLAAALEVFKSDDVGELSELVRGQFLKKLGK